jgi:HTH-type transcriptional regulator/antitoxin HigA
MLDNTVRFSEAELQEIEVNFRALSRLVPLGQIKSEDEYARAVGAMNGLLDAGGANEDHPLAMLVCIVGDRIAEYVDAMGAD